MKPTVSFPDFVFGDKPETVLYADPSTNSSTENHVLLGTYLKVKAEQNGFYDVTTRSAGPGGWVSVAHVTEAVPLKVFFVDVGQGDAVLIECPQGIVLVDGGTGPQFYSFLRDRYSSLIQAGKKVKIEAMFISHPDYDHYRGLQYVLEDKDFEISSLYTEVDPIVWTDFPVRITTIPSR